MFHQCCDQRPPSTKTHFRSLNEAEDINLISYLSTKTLTGNGFDQIRGVGKVNEYFLFRLQNRSRCIYQQYLRERRKTEREEGKKKKKKNHNNFKSILALLMVQN